MEIYAQHGFRDFVLCLGYKGDVIRDYFLNLNNRTVDTEIQLRSGGVRAISDPESLPDWRVVLAETGIGSHTARRLKIALKHVSDERFLATYGDGVADVDIAALIAHHEREGRLATVTAVHPSSRFGELDIDGNELLDFREKPQIHDGWINGGFFVFEKRAFDLVDESENVSLEAGLLEQLARQRQLAVYRHEGFWQCMDTHREMELLNAMWSSGKAPWAR
jgi:glucose-1-phosphate cytidylyltransferase